MSREEIEDGQREEAWSALAMTLTPIEPPESTRAQLSARLRGPERYMPFAGEVSRAFGLTAEAACEALRAIADPAAWLAGPSDGAGLLLTPALRAASTVISRLPKGTRFERHRHANRELTFVLDGTLLEDGSHAHGPGKLLDMPPGSKHEIAVIAEQGCLVVFGLRPS